MIKPLAAAAAYIAAIVGANYATAHYGLVPVGLGLMVTAGTYLAGLALLARDVVQDTAGRWAVLAALGVGAVVSWWMSTPALALASAAAFATSELLDMGVYTPLRAKGWARAVLASNAVGAVVDTLVFLWLADLPFPITWQLVTGQLIGKIVWATLLPVLLVVGVKRALPRHTVRAESA